MESLRQKPVEILLVEDNDDDSHLMLEAFKEGQVRSRVSIVEDGVEALDFLRRRPPYAQAPRPDLIVLDLNLPKKSGHEVLAELKRDQSLKRIPVVVLTTSASEKDILRSYDLSANCYITKPLDLDHFFAVVKTIDEFWLDLVRLPPT
jgi:two-component system, chemotaxis family, response regulator Rcp1